MGSVNQGSVFPIWGSWFGSVQVLVRTAQHGARPLGHGQPGPLAIVRTISAFPDQHQSSESFPVSSPSLPKSETRTEEEKKIAKFLGYVKSNLVHTLAHMHTWARGGSWPLKCCHPPGKRTSNQDIRAVYALATSWAGAAVPFCRWQKNPGEGCVTPAVP